MTPFQEELYRLIQESKKEATAFTTSSEESGNETHKIIKFSQKWDFKDRYEESEADKLQLENRYKKDQSRVVGDTTKIILKELIPVVDEVILMSKLTKEGSPLHRGVRLILSHFEKILQRREGGVIRPRIGQVFDPVKHQAISAEQDPEHYGNTVLEVYRYGYFVRGQVIREAEIKVKCGISKKTT